MLVLVLVIENANVKIHVHDYEHGHEHETNHSIRIIHRSMPIIDFHTHAFPDALAERAMAQLTDNSGVTAYLDGKVSSLLRSMDEVGIDQSVLCSIATRFEHFGPIMKWSKANASDRLIPFPSVHPRDPAALERLKIVREEGFVGVKLHPQYQEFTVDEAALDPFYARVVELGLIVLVHCGFDPAFPRDRIASGDRVAAVYRRHPGIKFIAAHLGAWDDWDLVREHLLGQPVYMDTSMSIDMMSPAEAEHFLTHHPAEYILFGSDSPWGNPTEPLERLASLNIDESLKEQIRYENARRLLGMN